MATLITEAKFSLHGIQPISVNSMHYQGNPRMGKTADAKDWTAQVFHRLSAPEIQALLTLLRSTFDSKQHVYVSHLTAFYPESTLVTKSGEISAKAIDTTNWEKPLIDLIFLKKFSEEPIPYGCPNLAIDDKYHLDCISKRRVGEPRIDVVLQIWTKDLVLEPA